MNPLLSIKLKQAEEALEEAGRLLAEDAGLNFVMNMVFYSFVYSVFGLLDARRISHPTHRAAIDLFEREFVETGLLDQRFMQAIRRSFELRPSCECEGAKKITREDIEQLLPAAREFLERVRQIGG